MFLTTWILLHTQASWLATLVSALMPKPEVRLRHAPVLVFDEFNSLGPNNENVYFADSFSRFIYGKGVTVLFVTQNEEVAKALCGLNRWQKIGPLPHSTIPDRTTVRICPCYTAIRSPIDVNIHVGFMNAVL